MYGPRIPTPPPLPYDPSSPWMKANDTALNGSQISLQNNALMGRRRHRLGSLVSQILDKLGARRDFQSKICFLPFGLSRTRGEGVVAAFFRDVSFFCAG